MNIPILFEPIDDDAYAPGYYYAHIPTLDLTTHGQGIEGARRAAQDLVRLWIEEKRANGEVIPSPHEAYFGQIDIPDAVLGA